MRVPYCLAAMALLTSLSAAAAPPVRPAQAPSSLDTFLQQKVLADTNGDQQVQRDELDRLVQEITDFTAQHPDSGVRALYPSRALRPDLQIDANGDGKVDMEEFMRYFDTNGDGVVTRGEIAQFLREDCTHKCLLQKSERPQAPRSPLAPHAQSR